MADASPPRSVIMVGQSIEYRLSAGMNVGQRHQPVNHPLNRHLRAIGGKWSVATADDSPRDGLADGFHRCEEDWAWASRLSWIDNATSKVVFRDESDDISNTIHLTNAWSFQTFLEKAAQVLLSSNAYHRGLCRRVFARLSTRDEMGREEVDDKFFELEATIDKSVNGHYEFSIILITTA